MYLKFCRTHEKLTKAACPMNAETHGRKTSVHVSIHLFADGHELVEWNSPLPDERLYMPAQIQVELRTVTLCDEMLLGVERVQQGKMAGFNCSGTAWDVFVNEKYVEFVYSIIEGTPGGRVQLEVYYLVLQAWQEFLSSENCLEKVVHFPVPRD